MTPPMAREAGLLLHLGSLPGSAHDGALGAEARRFVDFLAAGGFGWWQVLPINPVDSTHSPYQSVSSRAGDCRLLALDAATLGLDVDRATIRRHPPGAEDVAFAFRNAFLAQADAARRSRFMEFSEAHQGWLTDYSRYRALKTQFRHAPWWDWPAELRDRDPDALASSDRAHAEHIEAFRVEQFLFFEQWQALRLYASARGVRFLGDLPMFVAADSCDVWAHRGLFRLTREGRPVTVAGVPPDYFSRTGQRWGNPVYAWEAHREQHFQWWCERIEHQLLWFDRLRLDHFRGFAATWEIPFGDATAENGVWVPAPGVELFAQLERRLGTLPLLAEDLGTITDDVIELRRRFRLPGMLVLQFAFDSDSANPYLPHNHERQAMVCTGTHDNDTTLGWFEALDPWQRARVREYLGESGEPMPWPMIRAALSSVAALCILPMQDVLALPANHRLNTPGTTAGNWQWRFDWDWVDAALSTSLRRMNACYGRTASA